MLVYGLLMLLQFERLQALLLATAYGWQETETVTPLDFRQEERAIGYIVQLIEPVAMDEDEDISRDAIRDDIE